jgi:hypothetical protein
MCPPAVPAGTTELRLATVQKQGETVLFTLAGQLSSADQLLKVWVPATAINDVVSQMIDLSSVPLMLS